MAGLPVSAEIGDVAMVFSSLIFVFLFLPVTVIGYYVLGKRFQNIFLLYASLFFYAWGEPVYLLLMLLSISVNYMIGLMMDKMIQRRAVLMIGLLFNIGFLCFFKYAGLFLETASALAGMEFSFSSPALPLGISFYTFQAMSYLMDVYRREVSVQRSFLRFGLYISMFAQLVAGPIVSYGDIERQLAERRFDGKRFSRGVERFLIGLGKKVLLANNLGLLWATVKAVPAGELSPLTAWLGLAAFTLQIYFDFGGYSDMAIGIGKLFGFEFPENFRYPYLSASISEFWRRWHISLGAWFKSYVYIPLGGSRMGRVKLVRNLLVVWLLTGFWHGASWNFALWGLYYGTLIVAEKLCLEKWMQRWPAILRHGYTLLAVMIGWVLFEFSDLVACGMFLRALFTFANPSVVISVWSFLPLLLIGGIAATSIPKRLCSKLLKKSPVAYRVLNVAGYAGVTVLSTAYLVGATYNPFLYFRF